mmetsp:Transcript_116544/g.371944  ORF Transcript_116544/g.371944 Transcript_116544/m.371944 type:complete len:212 (-) Transcript_116544:51-686(-)
MGHGPSGERGPCCGGRPTQDEHGVEEEGREAGEFLQPRDVEKLILENRSEVERAMAQIGRRRAEVQESARQLDRQRTELEEALRHLETEREDIAAEWSRLEAGRSDLRAEREEARRLRAELQAGQDSLQVERQEVSRLRAELQASQKNSWWFTCAGTDGEKKHAEAKSLPHTATPMQSSTLCSHGTEDFHPQRLSFETRLPAEMARTRGGG